MIPIIGLVNIQPNLHFRDWDESQQQLKLAEGERGTPSIASGEEELEDGKDRSLTPHFELIDGVPIY